MKKHDTPKTRADVYALPCPLATKAVILYLIDQEDRVHTREEIALAMGLPPGQVEDAIHAGQRMQPPVLARIGPDGAKLHPRRAYLVNGHELRNAAATSTAKADKPKAKGKPKLDNPSADAQNVAEENKHE